MCVYHLHINRQNPEVGTERVISEECLVRSKIQKICLYIIGMFSSFVFNKYELRRRTVGHRSLIKRLRQDWPVRMS